MDEEAYRERLGEWRALLSVAKGRRVRSEFVWRLPGDRSQELGRLVEAELSCCPFLRLRVAEEEDRVLLRVGLEARRRPAPESRAEQAVRLLGALT